VAGSVFVPGSKPGEGRGVGWLRDLCAEAPLPVIAIGGIRPENVAACVAAGAAGVAVVTGITRAADPLAAVDPYLRELRAAKARALAEVRP
jgi:thiazole tautomerase (transcriptional regulator TenI)